jgi:hypothetical protein
MFEFYLYERTNCYLRLGKGSSICILCNSNTDTAYRTHLEKTDMDIGVTAVTV